MKMLQKVTLKLNAKYKLKDKINFLPKHAKQSPSSKRLFVTDQATPSRRKDDMMEVKLMIVMIIIYTTMAS